jgi:YHS domain-containing protein
MHDIWLEKEVLEMARDPVCNMEVDEITAQIKTEYEGKTYYFCCAPCKDAFDKEPDKYVKAEPGKSSCCG